MITFTCDQCGREVNAPEERALRHRSVVFSLAGMAAGWLALVAVASCSAKRGPSVEDPAEHLRRGDEYAQKGDLDRAIEEYNQAIELKPDEGAAYRQLTRVHMRKGDSDRAIADFTRSIGHGPALPYGYAERSQFLQQKGEINRAMEDCIKALDLDPNYARAHSRRGRIYAEEGDYERAMADHQRAIGLDPSDAWSYVNRGVAHAKKGDYDRAIVDYTKAIGLRPDDPDAYRKRGIAYSQKGDHDRAVADFAKATVLERDGDAGRTARTALRTLPTPLPPETAPATPDDLLSKACEKFGRSLRKRGTAEPDITIAVRRDGSAWVDGERYGHEALKRFLASKAAESPKDEEGLSTLSVRIAAHKDTAYKIVQRVMVACMKGHIWKLSFGALPEEKPGLEEEW